MSSSPVLLPPAEPDAGRRRVNGWELTLWILGFALLVACTVIAKLSIDNVILESAGRGQSTADPVFRQEIVIQEFASSFTPGMVTAGILCIALALFLRAFDVNARRRLAMRSGVETPDAIVSPSLVTAVSPVEPGRPVVPATTPASTTPADYAPFMRPSDDPDGT